MADPRSWRKRSLFIFACVLGALGYFLIDSIEQPTITPSSPVLGDEEADYYGEGIIYRQYGTDGRLQQTLTSQSTEHFPAAQITQFTQPFIITTNDNNKSWQIQSATGSLFDKEQLVKLVGEVEIQPLNPEPGRELLLRTDLLRYYTKTQLAETERPVEITNPRSYITAVGMELSVPDEVLKLNQQVKTRHVSPSHP